MKTAQSNSIASRGNQEILAAAATILATRGSLALEDLFAAVRSELGVEFHLYGASRYFPAWLADADNIHCRHDGHFEIKKQPKGRQAIMSERPFSYGRCLVGGRCQDFLR